MELKQIMKQQYAHTKILTIYMMKHDETPVFQNMSMTQPLFSIKIFLRQSSSIFLKTVLSVTPHQEYNQIPGKASLIAFKEIIPIFCSIHDYQTISKQGKKSLMGVPSVQRWVNQQKMRLYCAYFF